MTALTSLLKKHIKSQVAFALDEDIGSGDITAQLIPNDQTISATVISRQEAILCGAEWATEVFAQLDPSVTLTWHHNDGDKLTKNKAFLTLQGPARSILTGERAALNFLQTLSYTATITAQYQKIISGTELTILDTRKTIPGMRLAQKYAVTTGGGKNHRIGLYDAFLIKENHIMAAGSISNAIKMAKKISPEKTIEIETENLNEVAMAVEAGADIIMLDNFSYEDMTKAVNTHQGKVAFEASGNMTQEHLLKVAETGVNFVSIGALTKHVQAIDLSLRVSQETL